MAAAGVAGADLPLGGRLAEAHVLRPRAPWGKRAAHGHLAQIRRRARYGGERLALAFIHGQRGQQAAGIRVLRVCEQFPRGAKLHDMTAVHHRDAVADLRGHAQVVRHKHHGHAVFVLQLPQQLQDLSLDGHIQRRGRFIRQQQLGIGGQRDGDDHALAHSAGELVRIFPHALLRVGNAHAPQQLHGAGVLFLAGKPGVLEGFRYLLADAQHRVQRHHRLLEDHADLFAAHGGERLFGKARKLLPAVADAAARNASRAVDEPDEGFAGDALAAAALAHETEHLALLNGKAHTVHGLERVFAGIEIGFQVLDFEQYRFIHVNAPLLGKTLQDRRPKG